MLVYYENKTNKRKDTTNRKIENKATDHTLLYIKRKRETTKKIVSLSYCRDDRTRTCDHLVPNQVHYQLCYIPLCRSVPLFCVAKVILFFYSCKYFSKIILLFLVQQRFFSRFELHALLVLLYV